MKGNLNVIDDRGYSDSPNGGNSGDDPGTYYIKSDSTGEVLTLSEIISRLNNTPAKNADDTNNASDMRNAVKEIIMQQDIFNLPTKFSLDIQCDGMHSLLIDGKGHTLFFNTNDNSRNGIIGLLVGQLQTITLSIRNLIINSDNRIIAENNSILFKSITGVEDINTKVVMIASRY